MKLFNRNDQKTVKDILALSWDDFYDKYKDCSTCEAVLKDAWTKIRKKSGLNTTIEQRSSKAKKDEPLDTPLPPSLKGKVVSSEVRECSDGDTIRTTKLTDGSTIVETLHAIEVEETEEAAASGEESSKKKSGKKEKPQVVEGWEPKTDKDKRIFALLKEGKKPVDIAKIMTDEGITTYGPQVYKVKNAAGL